MRVPKEVATFVEEYEKINNQIKELVKELEACKKVFTDWEEANCDAGVWIGELFITDIRQVKNKMMENTATKRVMEKIGLQEHIIIKLRIVKNMLLIHMNVRLIN